MSNKIKEMLKSILLQFDGVQTDKGMLTWNGDKQLEIGDEVYLDEKPAPDGDYVVDDKVFEVENGKVKEIKVKEMEDEKPENLETEPSEPTEPAEPTEPESKEDKPAPDEKDQKITELENKVAELENKLADIIARIEKVESAPVVEPIVEEFDKVNKPKTTGNKTVDKYSRIFGSK